MGKIRVPVLPNWGETKADLRTRKHFSWRILTSFRSPNRETAFKLNTKEQGTDWAKNPMILQCPIEGRIFVARFQHYDVWAHFRGSIKVPLGKNIFFQFIRIPSTRRNPKKGSKWCRKMRWRAVQFRSSSKKRKAGIHSFMEQNHLYSLVAKKVMKIFP